MRLPSGGLTQNGMFFEAAAAAKAGVDAWRESANGRQVFKFRLEIRDDPSQPVPIRDAEPEHTRVIPTAVKLEVWKRDGGKCVRCGASDNLHFDHDIPYSKGGSSLTAANIQLLCTRHNLGKRDRVE